MNTKVVLLLLSLCFMPSLATAEIIVLIHGYLGSPNSWEHSGINQQLENAGWQRSGVYASTPQGIYLFSSPEKLAKNKAYSVHLASKAPIRIQAKELVAIMDVIVARHPDENITLIGHSAGGLVARKLLVDKTYPTITRLITIATPHSGTPLAVKGLKETGSGWPIGMVKDTFGGGVYDTVKSSRPLLYDFLTPRPWNFLHWLNLQAHPNIEYISLVTMHPQHGEGDEIVPGFSQNMNNVPALEGRSKVIKYYSNHYLDEAEGKLLVEILTGK